jgi:hypothetical protein
MKPKELYFNVNLFQGMFDEEIVLAILAVSYRVNKVKSF